MAILKKQEEIEIIKEAGRRHARILRELAKMVAPGVNLGELDVRAGELVEELGDTSAFLGYTPEGARRPYPANTCISVNQEIVHGVPTEDPHICQEGDIISIDFGLTHRGLITDAALTVPVGEVSKDVRRLMHATRTALEAGIAQARAGNTTGDIGAAIQNVAEKEDVAVFRELVGHGVGKGMHEWPYVPNYGKAGEGDELMPGLVIAIEPMFGLGTKRIKLASDGYTYETADGSYSAHFEHTVLITEDKPIILTK